MSISVNTNFRGYLISSSSVTSLVSSNNIKIGWTVQDDEFPCIIIHQDGGEDVGFLGYNKSSAGSKTRREKVSLQIDIYSQTSQYEVDQIADAIVPIMISGGCRKISDMNLFNDEIDVWRKTQIYEMYQFHDD